MSQKQIYLKILLITLILSSVFTMSACNTSPKSDSKENTKVQIEESEGESSKEKEDTVIIEEEAKKDEGANTEQKPVEKETSKGQVEICFTGDVMMDSFIGDYIRDQGVDYPWTDVSPILNEADLTMVNLETSVSTRGQTKKPTGYGFRSEPYTVEGLVNSGIDLVSIANNHILDFGQDAFLDTMDTLKENNIQYVGAGKNKKEADEPTFIEKNGIKFGFLAYTQIIPYEEWPAADDRPGIAPLRSEDYEQIFKNIEAADKQCDFLIIVPHWGIEYSQKPEQWQVDLAHKMIDNGADAIVGHHPHVLQGIEFYKEKPILYSIGNFVFLKNDDLCGNTGVFKMTFYEKGYKNGTFYPVDIQYCKADLLNHEEGKGKEITDMLRELSEPMGTKIGTKGQIGK